MKGKLFFVGVFALYFLANGYLGFRIYPLVEQTSWSIQVVYWIAVALLTISPLLFFAFRKRVSVPKAAILYKVGTGWLMLIIYSFLFALLSEIIVGIFGDYWIKISPTWFSIAKLQASVIIVGTVLMAFIGNINYYRKK